MVVGTSLSSSGLDTILSRICGMGKPIPLTFRT
jgi:hypothetical protein